jgi:hypothetical protein
MISIYLIGLISAICIHAALLLFDQTMRLMISHVKTTSDISGIVEKLFLMFTVVASLMIGPPILKNNESDQEGSAQD